ncbi:MAG: response regulator transcription factor [Leptospiraceae bacterium]|nr:response regulator transcription factor [Leptospiraceae bacterium]
MESKKVRIILAEDHEIFRLGIKLILDSEENLEVVAEVGNGNELMEAIEKVESDLIISDYLMPGLDGVSSLLIIKQLYPSIKTILLTSVEEPFLQELAFENSIQGYIFKSQSKEEILEAIHVVLDGKIYYSSKFSSQENIQTSGESPFNKLTKKESEIVWLLSKGFSRAEVCKELQISIKTLETHRTNISSKTNTRSIAQLIRLAYLWGLVTN